MFKDSQRFKGHSKWDNIRHIKAEKDYERMLLFKSLKLQMKVAIQEHGSTKPDNNLKLAQVIENAKKANMPISSIKSFLEKMEATKNKIHEGIAEIRGPNGYAMLIYYNTNNVKQFKMDLRNRLKKCSGNVADSSVRNMFTHIGNIIVEKKNTLEQATEDAIDIGAQDINELEENNKQYFQVYN
ncbi:Coiled-coil domain-containing protein 44 [Harpegnathos saltator]|uniref:Coiled-coil domain-containing protein 44 n=1 Tax=Harpegnathos saltator TaxID=610380 RepID=E2C7B9_HARSA|nr:Coiled-coil domain-containing protein 44 [Harpegnathos saltator]